MESRCSGAYAAEGRSAGWLSITSSKTLTACPRRVPRGEGDFMVRPLSPGNDPNEFPQADRAHSTRFNMVGAPDQQFVEDATVTPGASLSLLADDDGPLASPPAPRALSGRADIDTAMVEALKSAMASDHGPSGSGWDTPDREQFGDARRSIDLMVSTWGPPEFAGRCDIDLAMLDALRLAMGADPGVPDA